MYCRDGVPGLLRSLDAGYSRSRDKNKNVKFTQSDRVTFDVDGYSLSTTVDAIYDYRVKSWTDVRYELSMSEEEFFQLSLLQEVIMTYDEYLALSDISAVLRMNQYDDCEWEDL